MPERAPYRILVTGSRDWEDRSGLRVASIIAMEAAHKGWHNVVVVHGGCPTGADALASAYVRKCAATFAAHGAKGSITEEVHTADWSTKGRAGGPIRNAVMVAAGADLCVAFIRNASRGATHCADLAEAAGIETRRYLA